MNEWNRIDLHMHTVPGITRDKTKDKVNFSFVNFSRVIRDYNLKLMAVTNHNFIDIQNYILLRHLAKIYGTNILMGVELDSNLSVGTPIHIACIFNDKFNDNFYASLEINKCVESKKLESEIYFTDDEIINLLKSYDLLMIPHGNKDKGIFKYAGPEQIEEALKKIREGFIRIFDSPTDWKLAKIKEYLKSIDETNLDIFGGVLFSDNRDWENYDKNYRAFYMNAEPTFKGLVHSTTNPVKRFKAESEIEINNNYIKKIKFKNKNENSRIVEGEIEFSSGYNCIIGKSGTGKSLLLYILKNKLQRNNESDDNYKFIENTEIEIYNENGDLLTPENINLGIGANLFNKIITATSTNDDEDYYEIINLLSKDFKQKEIFKEFKNKYNQQIKKYCELDEFINKDSEELLVKLNKYNSDNIKLELLKNTKTFDVSIIDKKIEIKYSDSDKETFSKYEENLNELEELIKIYKGAQKEKILDLFNQLKVYLDFANKDICNQINSDNIIMKKRDIINDTIAKINKTKSTQAAEKSRLLSSIPLDRTNIINTVLTIYKNKSIKNSIDLSIKNLKYNSEKKIDETENIVVKEFIPKEIFEIVNEKDNNIFNTYGKKGHLSKDENYNLFSNTDAKKIIDKYIGLGILTSEKDALSNNLNVLIEVLFDGQNVKQLNPGTIAKKYIEHYFDEQVKSSDKNVVLFDQIENDVDKDFINTVIRKLIEDTKGKVQLIVVTHDPIVAVNADPNNYIEAQKNGDKINYRNFVAESTEKDELNTIACTVDGSKDVIRGRYEIYKGDKDYGN